MGDASIRQSAEEGFHLVEKPLPERVGGGAREALKLLEEPPEPFAQAGGRLEGDDHVLISRAAPAGILSFTCP